VVVNPHGSASFNVQASLGNNGDLPRTHIAELDVQLEVDQAAIEVGRPVPNGFIVTATASQPVTLIVSALSSP
jgi:hypothetical protein